MKQQIYLSSLILKEVQPLIVLKKKMKLKNKNLTKTEETHLVSEQVAEQQPMRNCTTVMGAVVSCLDGP